MRVYFSGLQNAASCVDQSGIGEPSAFQLASTKAARHMLEQGIWTSVRLGDMRRALAACEQIILLEVNPREFRGYSILLYHCGFYEQSLQFLSSYQKRKVDFAYHLQQGTAFGSVRRSAQKNGGRCCRKTNDAPSFVNDGGGLEPAIPGQIFPRQQSRTMVKDVQGFRAPVASKITPSKPWHDDRTC